MSKVIENLISGGLYTRGDDHPLTELTEHFMEKELSFLAIPSLGKDLVNAIKARASRAAEVYLQQNPDYS